MENIEPQTARCGQPRILLLEDEWLIALDLQETLEGAGYTIVGPAPSVQKALAFIESEQIEAALIDVHVGSDSSYRVAQALRTSGIPFAFLSGHSQADLSPEFQDELLLSKPVEIGELTACLTTLLGSGA